jgi:hypothetical protein
LSAQCPLIAVAKGVSAVFRGAIVCALTLAALAVVARPAAAYSLVSLEPGERTEMLNTCNRLSGDDQTICRSVVDDGKVVVNYKRSCLEAMTLLLRGTAWSKVKSLPPAMTCREGLALAGYPVQRILRRLAGVL